MGCFSGDVEEGAIIDIDADEGPQGPGFNVMNSFHGLPRESSIPAGAGAAPSGAPSGEPSSSSKKRAKPPKGTQVAGVPSWFRGVS